MSDRGDTLVVRSAVAPLNAEPTLRSEQVSQLLAGHLVERIAERGAWLRVRAADGYEGWMHVGYTEIAEGADCAEWGWDTNREMSMGCSLRDSRGVTRCAKCSAGPNPPAAGSAGQA